jgi:hypothetical protein
MSITRLNWPSLNRRPSEWSWKFWPLSQTWASPLSRGTQTLELPGACWWCKVGYTGVREDDWREFSAFLSQMRGMSGRVLLWPMHAEAPRGVATGSPVVAGANQTGRSLVTSGWTPSIPLILRRGDFFSVPTQSGPELKILTADAASNASGGATLAFEPPLRSAPASGAVITTTRPTCAMRFVDDSQGETAADSMRRGTFTLELVEAWL